jgi:hypothetical protein
MEASDQLYRFTAEEGAPSTHRLGNGVSPRAGLDNVVKRGISFRRESKNPLFSNKKTRKRFFLAKLNDIKF